MPETLTLSTNTLFLHFYINVYRLQYWIEMIESEIREILDRETRAWDTQDVELLMTVFHPDMVWP